MPLIDDIDKFMKHSFPDVNFTILELGDMGVTIRKPIEKKDLRPGNIVSGPTLMTLSDMALYLAIFGKKGLTAQAVTTNLNIHFLRPTPSDRDLIVKCKIIKLGITLATGEVDIYSEGGDEIVAKATGTYALPHNSGTN